jgi:AraC-like DNA-binding protein
LPYQGREWDIIVHASIPNNVGEPFELWHDPYPHAMPYHVVLVVSGQGRVERAGGNWPLSQGDLMVVDPGGSTVVRGLNGGRIHLLPFSFNLRLPDAETDLVAPLREVLQEWADEPLRPMDAPLHLDDLRAAHFHELIIALNSHSLPGPAVEWFPLHQRAFDLLAFTIAAFAAEAGGATTADPALQRVRDRIERRFAESLSLDELAREAGLSPYYLCRKFKATYGLPPQQYQQYIQIRAACNYLRTSNLRIKEIARQCGFASPEHFTRLFRKRVGQSPRAYRANGPAATD